MNEAHIIINGIELNAAQSMAVRVAVCGMLEDLQEPAYRQALGQIAEGYKARLSEVQKLIVPC